MLSERRRRRERAQRGSVLSGVLIIVAFLAILGGALTNEISAQFLLAHNLSSHLADQATVNSSVENAIGQLQTRGVPSRCSTDTSPNWTINLNGKSATATPKCVAITPDLATSLAAGAFSQDGTHVVMGGRDTYLVGDSSSSGRVYSYSFGQTLPNWSVRLGTAVTGPPSQELNPDHRFTLVPEGNAVALIDDNTGSASRRCDMGAAGTVTSRPGVENAPAGVKAYFPDYAFFGDSSGNLYVYDATVGGTCAPLASSNLGGAVVGGPLVLTGTQTNGESQCQGQGSEGDQDQSTCSVEVFVLVNQSGSSVLLDYRFSQVAGLSEITHSLSLRRRVTLPFANATGVAYSSTIPADGGTIRLAITSGSGQVTLASIAAENAGSGLTYTMSWSGSTANFGGSFTHAPYWWHFLGGDLIGAGNNNGTLVVLDTNLKVWESYDGAADGHPAINSTPAPDANGDWYFGADDGYVYDVEPPASGTLMFKAARFGPGGAVRSSPVVGSPSDGCSTGPCLYFGATATSYFTQIGKVRVMDLNACLSAQPCPTAGIGNPRLWARLEVGSPSVVGGQGVNVIGWSYYSP